MQIKDYTKASSPKTSSWKNGSDSFPGCRFYRQEQNKSKFWELCWSGAVSSILQTAAIVTSACIPHSRHFQPWLSMNYFCEICRRWLTQKNWSVSTLEQYNPVTFMGGLPEPAQSFLGTWASLNFDWCWEAAAIPGKTATAIGSKETAEIAKLDWRLLFLTVRADMAAAGSYNTPEPPFSQQHQLA